MNNNNHYDGLTDEAIADNLCDSFPYLYHAVPEKHTATFESGVLKFNKASNVRKIEEDAMTFSNSYSEGTIKSTHDCNGVKLEIIKVQEFFMLCFSLTNDIRKIRQELDKTGGKRTLYKVDMKKLLPSISHSLKNTCYTPNGGWLYFQYPNKDPSNIKTYCNFQGGMVRYASPGVIPKKDIEYNSWLYKYPHFKREEEFRLVLEFIDLVDDPLIDEGRNIYPPLTTLGDNKIELKIDPPDGCFEKVSYESNSPPQK